MALGGVPSRKLHAAFAAVFAVALLAVGGCAGAFVSKIARVPPAASPELQEIARLARQGDKYAQLELGIRYEEARGLPRDVKRAKELYRLAAAASGGTIQVYVPPVGRGGSGRVIPVNLGARQQGLAEAKARLDRLK